MINIDWLNKLLEPNSQREITKQLWRYNDKVIVTNGIAMIVLDENNVDCTNISPLNICIDLISEILHEYRSITSYKKKVDLQDFKEWLGEPETKRECDCKNVVQKCPKCNGKGIIECSLGEEHDCWECGGKGKGYYCEKCYDGWIKPNKRYISVLDVVINGNVLAQYLQELHDVSVNISCNGDKPVKFSGNGWDVYIMPVRDVKQEVRKYERGRE